MSYADLMNAALAASARDDTAEAMRFFAQASSLEPGNGVPHLLMAGELMRAGDVAAAEAAYANALLVAPGLAIARYQLGLLQFTQGRAALALVTWQLLLTAGDGDGLARFVRGFEALVRDDFALAEHEFVHGMQRNTSNEPLNRDIQMVLDRIRPLMAGGSDAAVVGQQPVVADLPLASQVDATSEHVLLANYHQRGLPH
jgi:Flp pilus assembly protein TadD